MQIDAKTIEFSLDYDVQKITFKKGTNSKNYLYILAYKNSNLPVSIVRLLIFGDGPIKEAHHKKFKNHFGWTIKKQTKDFYFFSNN
jgi:hypothetical protein